MAVILRAAKPDDDAALRRIDIATWSRAVSPVPAPSGTRSFFDSTTAGDVLVAEVNGQAVGYVGLGHLYKIESSSHVLEIKGLAVDPGWQRRGVGRALLDAAIAEARKRDARRVVLRVLGSNAAARALYEQFGFRTEGILRQQFLLDGSYVDDVFMALDLTERA